MKVLAEPGLAGSTAVDTAPPRAPTPVMSTTLERKPRQARPMPMTQSTALDQAVQGQKAQSSLTAMQPGVMPAARTNLESMRKRMMR